MAGSGSAYPPGLTARKWDQLWDHTAFRLVKSGIDRRPVCVNQEKREDVDWLFRCMLTSLKDALHNAGPLFAFVPEFYVEACISAYSALKSYFTPSLLSPQSPGALFVFIVNFIL